MSRRDMALIFYVGVPTVFGLSLGWQGGGMMAVHFSKPVSLLYWVGAANLVWITLELATRIAAAVVPKGKTPLIAILLLGFVLQPFFGRPFLSFWQLFYVDLLPPEVTRPNLAYFYASFIDYGQILVANSFICGVWISFNILFDRILGVPRFRTATGYRVNLLDADESTQSDSPAQFENTGLLLRLPTELGKTIIALSAEDHYVRVHTPEGNDLILYRFSDAVREMPDNIGLQVHRSHWINLSAISSFEESGRGSTLTLNETIKIPVSQRYIEVLKTRGVVPERI